MNIEVLGVDVGGVIIDRVNDGTDTSFLGDNYLQTTAVPGAFEALRRLVDERFGTEVWIISKCGPRVQEKTLHWFDHNDFYSKTGISRDHVWFCRQRSDKNGICRKLGTTHFVDDHMEVLANLDTVPNLFLFQSRDDDVRRFAEFLDRVQQADNWEDIIVNLLGI